MRLIQAAGANARHDVRGKRTGAVGSDTSHPALFCPNLRAGERLSAIGNRVLTFKTLAFSEEQTPCVFLNHSVSLFWQPSVSMSQDFSSEFDSVFQTSL